MTPASIAIVLALSTTAVLLWPGHRRVRGTAAPELHRSGPPDSRRPVAPRLDGRPGTGPPPAAQAIADALVLIVLALRSGASVTESVAQVAECSTGAVQRDLSRVVAALAWGASAVEAWADLGPAWRPAALAFTMSAETGASPSMLLDSAARRVREQHEAERSRRAARAGVLLVLPLGLGFLPAFACTAVVPVVLALAEDVLSRG